MGHITLTYNYMKIQTIHASLFAMIALIIALTSIVHAQGILVTPDDFSNALKSENYDERTKACESLIAAYNGSTDGQKTLIRSRYTDAVLSMLNAPIDAGEDWAGPATPRNLAVRLAGALKITQAIPRLIELLRPLDGERVKPSMEDALTTATTGSGLQVSPSAKALIQIGDEAKTAMEAEQVKSISSLNDNSISIHSKEHHYRSLKLSNIRYIIRTLREASPQNLDTRGQ